jgi:secondary thiamine-phosphate synthase enzyme
VTLTGEIAVATVSQRELIDITEQVQEVVAASGIPAGVCILYTPHTTSGLIINEGADPDVRRDILGALDRIVPSDYPYRHREGNSPAHLMAALTGASITVFVSRSRLQLGTWQRLFFCEFDGPRQRSLWWKILAG